MPFFSFVDDGLALETSAFESLYGGQFSLSTQLIKPNYPAINKGWMRKTTCSCPRTLSIPTEAYHLELGDMLLIPRGEQFFTGEYSSRETVNLEENKRGKFLKKLWCCVGRDWGVLQDNLVLSAGLIM